MVIILINTYTDKIFLIFFDSRHLRTSENGCKKFSLLLPLLLLVNFLYKYVVGFGLVFYVLIEIHYDFCSGRECDTQNRDLRAQERLCVMLRAFNLLCLISFWLCLFW
jgi:hypothetical protein